MARVTIKDVAQKAGVSITTVSRVLNDKKIDEYMRKETKDRILQAIKELNFKPDKRAQSLRGLRTKIIGLVIPNRLNPYFEQLAAAVEQVCYKEGYGVLLCSSQNSIERESVYIDLLERQKVDAIILSTVGLKKDELNDLIERGTPIVLVDEDVPGVNAPAIFANNYMGGCQATQYLIDLGHRRIAFITGSMNLLSSKDRLRGFCETLKKNDLEPDRKLIKEGDYTYESGYEAGKQLLRKSGDDFTAIFCSDDLMAFGVMQAIRKKGMKVPDDYSIVGFDDMYFSSISSPLLTTVAQPVKEMAFRAFVALKEQISGEFFQEKKHQFLDTQLIVRESSRPLGNWQK
jgi:LacI family transcriptional regulator